MQEGELPTFATCTRYLHKYHACLRSAAQKEEKVKECRKLLDYYEFCLIKAQVADQQARTARSPPSDI
jgi:hypothetical protein